MSLVSTRGLQDDAVNGSKIKLDNNQNFRARNAANSADINLFKLNASDILEYLQLPQYSGSSFATQGYVTTQLSSYIPSSEKGANNGVATLDSNGKIPSSQLTVSAFEYKGTYNASTNSPSLVNGTGSAGDQYKVSVAGSQDFGSGSISFAVGDYVLYNGSIWEKVDTTDAVSSVNSQTGAVVLTTSDISEGTNLYYTAARFNTAFSGKSTTDLAEGTNLYHTTARARTAAVVNSTASNETDQAASVSAMKSYVTANSGDANFQYFTLNGTDITNGYKDLSVAVSRVIAVDVKGWSNPQWLADDYSVSLTGGTGGTTRVTFAGDMLSLISGDKIKVTYKA